MNTIISFKICPFVQRSLITLNVKKVPYEVKYIDLKNKPDWFLKLSPTGKVPLLKVDDEIVFESAVINEYIDEISGKSLFSENPLEKVHERSLISFCGDVTFNYLDAIHSDTEKGYQENKLLFEHNFSKYLDLYKGPFFYGDNFSLLDSSIIPILFRFTFTKKFKNDLKFSEENMTKFNKWTNSTLHMPEVIHSMPEDFEIEFSKWLENKNSYIFKG